MDLQKQGFALQEVASVTAFISILAAISYPMINNLIGKTEYAAAKLALSSFQKKCEGINMLGVKGTGEMVNIRGYKIKTAKGTENELSELCNSGAVVFISEKEVRPSLYYNIRKNTTGCLVSGKYLSSYPECAAKEQTSLAEALNKEGNLMKSGNSEYYSFSGSEANTGINEGLNKDCNDEVEPGCRE